MSEEKHLADYTLLQWGMVLFLSFWGSSAAYANQMLKDRRRFRLGEFIAKAVVAMFAGIMVFLVCESANVPELTREALVSMAGFLGSETLAVLRVWFRRRLGVFKGAPDSNE